jgi:hypothetical protein
LGLALFVLVTCEKMAYKLQEALMAHILYLFLAASLRSRELRWVFSFTIERRSRVFQRPFALL